MRFYLFYVFIFLAARAGAQPTKYPQIKEWQNTPILEFNNDKKALLKKETQLKNPFVVVTANTDQVTVEFVKGEMLTVFEKTRVQVPQVGPDTGEASEIFIFDGTIRFRGLPNEKSKLHLKSAFFDLQMPAGIDVLVTIDKHKPSAQFQVIRGEMTAAFLDFEKTEVVKAGESILFEGENDANGNLKYDYLLDSKRLPHGVLKEKEKFDFSSFIEKEKQQQMALEKNKIKQKKAETLKQAQKKKAYDSFLCHEPQGQKDQCYWLKENDEKCYRYRCNVQGQWGDKTERPLNVKCLTKPEVSPCDF